MKFSNTVKVEWPEGEARDVILLEDVSFIDPNGKVWIAPAGWKVNGASIPRIFWSMVGSPFVGLYRRASVLHDVYCDTRSESWLAVHRMFYDAMVCDGVDRIQADLLYNVVNDFGPRWDENGNPLPSYDQNFKGIEWRHPLSDI